MSKFPRQAGAHALPQNSLPTAVHCPNGPPAPAAAAAGWRRSIVIPAWAALMAMIPSGSHAESPDAAFFAQLQAHVFVVKTATGSGSAVSLDARRLASNCHLVADEHPGDLNLRVEAHAGAPPLPASLVARDPKHDVCLIALDGGNSLPEKAKTPISTVPVHPGDRVYAVGAPLGFPDTVTDGVVSALQKHQDFPVSKRPHLWNTFYTCSESDEGAEWYIQTSAEVTNGSSGGGLFNADGELIGIPTFGFEASGMAIRFAVPAEHVRTLADQDPDTALGEVVSFFASTGNIEMALETSGRIRSPYQLTRALRDIAKAELSAGRPAAAARTLMKAVSAAKQIEDPNRRAKRLSALAGRLAKAKAFRLANQTAAGIDVPKQQARAFADIARTLAREERFADARRTVRKILEPRIRAKTGDYVIRRQISAWLKSGELSSALQAVGQIKSLPNRIAVHQRIAGAYGKLDNVPAARGAYAEAIRLTRLIHDLSDRAEILIDIAADQADEDYTANAAATADAAMRAAGQISDPTARDKAFRSIVGTLADMPGFTAKLFLAAEQVADPLERDRANAVIAESLADQGKFRRALQVTPRIEDRSVRGGALHRIVRELADAEKSVQALAVAAGIGDPASRAQALRDVATARADAGATYAAIGIARQIGDPAQAAAVYAFVAEVVIDADRSDRKHAEELLAEAERLARKINDQDDRAKMLVEIAVLYVHLHESGQAKRIVRELQSSRDFAYALRRLSKTYANLGNFTAAQLRIDEMPLCAGRQRERAMDHLAEEMAGAGASGPVASR